MNRMKSSHEGASAGRANGVDIVVMQNETAEGQGVQVWSGDLVGAVETNIIPTLGRNRKIYTIEKRISF